MQLLGEQDVHENFDTAYRTYGTRLQKFLGNFTSDSSMIATILDNAISEWLITPQHYNLSRKFPQLLQIARRIALTYTQDCIEDDQVAENREKYYRFPNHITSEDRAIFYAEYFHGLDLISISKVFKRPLEEVIAARNEVLLHIRPHGSEEQAKESRKSSFQKLVAGVFVFLRLKKTGNVK